MNIKRHRTVLLAGISAFFLTTISYAGYATAISLLEATSALDGISASSTVNAFPAAVWYGQMNRDGICRLLTGCSNASGEGNVWNYPMKVETPVGVQTVNLTVTVKEQTPPSRMVLALQQDSALGNLTGTMEISLSSQGLGTLINVNVPHMEATGEANLILANLPQQLQPILTRQSEVLQNETASADVHLLFTIKKGTKARGVVQVTADTLTVKRPVATGVLRILVNNVTVCTAPVRRNMGTCMFPRQKPGTRITAVVTGTLSNGYPIWTSAEKRYPR